jgi:hypothetical protein
VKLLHIFFQNRSNILLETICIIQISVRVTFSERGSWPSFPSSERGHKKQYTIAWSSLRSPDCKAVLQPALYTLPLCFRCHSCTLRMNFLGSSTGRVNIFFSRMCVKCTVLVVTEVWLYKYSSEHAERDEHCRTTNVWCNTLRPWFNSVQCKLVRFLLLSGQLRFAPE